MDVPRVAYEKLADQRLGEPSEVVQARVETARERQRMRLAGTDLACNADTRSGPADVRKGHRVLKLVRTIADLAGSDATRSEPAHVAEAIQYRPRRQN